MGVRRVKKVDLKRIAKATGATFLTSLSNMDGNIQLMDIISIEIFIRNSLNLVKLFREGKVYFNIFFCYRGRIL